MMTPEQKGVKAPEGVRPSVTIHAKIEKYHGELVEGAEPYEVVEFSETISGGAAEILGRLGVVDRPDGGGG